MHFLLKVREIGHAFKLNQVIKIEYASTISFCSSKIYWHRPKSPFWLDFVVKRWLKIILYISSKNVAIVIRFILAIAVLKAKSVLLPTSKLTLANKKIIGHYKSDRLNIIYKSGILSMIISTHSWRQYS